MKRKLDKWRKLGKFLHWPSPNFLADEITIDERTISESYHIKESTLTD